jgi:hypothetical protein
LAVITTLGRRDQSLKRGGAAGTDETAAAANDFVALEEVVGTEPDPAFAALLADEFQALLTRCRMIGCARSRS